MSIIHKIIPLINFKSFFILLLPIFSGFSQHSPPNVLFIAVDDLKPSIRSFGDDIAITPNLDNLAKNATLFLNNHAQEAWCTASRASVLTGRRPDYTTVHKLNTKIRKKRPHIKTLPEHFKNSGYHVVGIGKIFDPRSVDQKHDVQSWDTYIPGYKVKYSEKTGKPTYGFHDPEIVKNINKITQSEAFKNATVKFKFFNGKYKPPVSTSDVPDDSYHDGAIANHAVGLLNDLKNNEKPFFLAVGFQKPHLPFVAPKKYWNLYNRDKLPIAEFQGEIENRVVLAGHGSGELSSNFITPDISYTFDKNSKKVQLDEAFQKELIHGYYACVSYVDFQIGKLIQSLKQNGLYDNTIIVVWGDHGFHLGDHSMWCKHSNFEQATRSPLLIYNPKSNTPVRVTSPTEFVDLFPTLCDISEIDQPEGLEGKTLTPLMNLQKNSTKAFSVSQYERYNKGGNVWGYSFRSDDLRYTMWLRTGLSTPVKLNDNDIIAEELYDYKSDPNESINHINTDQYASRLKDLKHAAVEFMRSGHIPESLVTPLQDPNKNQSSISNLLEQAGFDTERVYVGATLNHNQLNTPVAEKFLTEFSYSTPENCAKQARIHPSPNIWDWSQIDDYLAFADQNNITLRIHGPVSPQASHWAKQDHRTKEELEKNMVEFFTALCKRMNTEKSVKWMDVVNETITPEGDWFEEKPGVNLWENPWEQIGRDENGYPIYITKAFEIANRYAPNISLVFNQHGGMEPLMWERVKKTILYLKSKGLRVDGLGWQAHLRSDQPLALDQYKLKYFAELIDWAHANDLDFHVTEIDYKIWNEQATPQTLNEQAAAYANILKVLLSKTTTGVVTYNTWGMEDGKPGKHHDKMRFIYDKNLRPKPALYAIKRAIIDSTEPLIFN